MRHRRRDAEGRHLVRLEPDAHREGAVAENLGALHAADGAQLRLHDAHEVVGDLVLIEILRREAEVRRGELAVGRLQVDDRRFRFGRKLIAHLRHLRLDLRQRGVGVVVEFQVNGDRADALRARRLEVVDAVRAGDDALERRGDESAHEIGIRADVGGASRRRWPCRCAETGARSSERMACNPAMRITRLTTIASTGRRTKRSVNFI